MVGRLTMELEVAKKSLGLAPLGPEAKRQVVVTLAAEHPVRPICRATGWPRCSVYHDAAPSTDEVRLRRALGRLAARWPTYLSRRRFDVLGPLGAYLPIPKLAPLFT
jgi:hypothetical protein